MKFTYYLIVIIFFTNVTNTIAQSNTALKRAMTDSRIANNAELDPDIVGTKFITENFELGILTFVSDNESTRNLLRYNVYDDLFEIKNEEQINHVIKTSDIDINLAGKKYSFISDLNNDMKFKPGYYEVIHLFKDGSRLLQKYSKRHIAAKAPKSSYDTGKPARIIDARNLVYLGNDNNPVEINNHKKRVLDFFDKDERKEYKNLIKKRKLEFDDYIYTGIIELIEHSKSKS